jgi:pyruvate/2-oxoglutarate dehydrogenase complex dihydrolipoamide dehydrogenase (E3) component
VDVDHVVRELINGVVGVDALHEGDGGHDPFVKLLADPETRRRLAAHIIGPSATSALCAG